MKLKITLDLFPGKCAGGEQAILDALEPVEHHIENMLELLFRAAGIDASCVDPVVTIEDQ